MTSALLGYTGFVGSNLAASASFDDLYNSRNIAELPGRSYDLVVSSANRADSFRINNHPEEDLAEITAFADTVKQARIGKLVLISTVCVYEADTTPDEDAPIDTARLTPYGVNRAHLERVLSDSFDTLIVRLPQLYGRNLKKGAVYDLANRYRIEYLDPENRFQYYDLERLWGDISVALDAGLPSLNIATPPLTTEFVASEVFGIDIRGQVPAEPPSAFSRMYTRDMRTKHAALFGGTDGYLQDLDAEVADLRAFAAEQQQTAGSTR